MELIIQHKTKIIMTYLEAEDLVNQHLNLIGKPIDEDTITYIVISTQEKLTDLINLYLANGFDNKAALSQLDMLDDDLSVFLFPNLTRGVAIYWGLEKYLREYRV